MKKQSRDVIGRSGFTLVEMVVTIGVFAIMAAIAIPGFSKWVPGYKLKNAARDVYSNMQLAKLEAIKRGGNCIITIDAGANTYSMDTWDGTNILTVTLADYGNTIFFTGATDNTITFSPRGMATFSSGINKGYVFLTNTPGSATYRVEISSAGNVNLDKV